MVSVVVRLTPDTKQVPGTTQRGAAMATNALTIPVRGRDSDFTGPVDGCRITVATPNLPPVAFGQILHLTDDAVIKVMNNSKGFELLISVQASGFVSDKAA